MRTQSTSLEPNILRNTVIKALSERWIKPAPNVEGLRVPRDEVDAMSRAALDTMLTRQFRNGKSPEKDIYSRQLKCVRHWVRGGRPIRVNVGYAPMKNPNATHASRADWAEFFALCHLCAWHNKVQAVYPPGLKIKIVFDDSAVGLANRPDRELMDSYIGSMGQLVSSLGYNSFIRGIGRHSSFAWLFHIAPFPLARIHLWFWERKAAHRPIIEKMNAYARRNLVLPAGLSEQEQEEICRKASHRYRRYWEALLISLWIQRVTFFGHSLIAMYLDGNQHHIPLRTALHLTTVGKGQITQPWQGEGALCDNGHGQLIPFVLTQSRRPRVRTEVIDGLDLLPLAGFDRIEVCAEPGPDQNEPGSISSLS
jgi:hypothetical protein